MKDKCRVWIRRWKYSLYTDEGDLMPSRDKPARQERYTVDHVDEILTRISVLNPKSQHVIIRRLQGVTLEQIGKELGVSKQYIAQINFAAKRTLKGTL